MAYFKVSHEYFVYQRTSAKEQRLVRKRANTEKVVGDIIDNACSDADVAKLADALDSKSSSVTGVPVQIRPSAPKIATEQIGCFLFDNNYCKNYT